MDSAAVLIPEITEAGQFLRESDPDWRAVTSRISDVALWLNNLGVEEETKLQPYLIRTAFEAVTSTLVSLLAEDQLEARRSVERLRQTMRDIAQSERVGPTADRRDVVAWVNAALPGIPMSTIADLVDVAPRTWTRWRDGDKDTGQSREVESNHADRLRVVAQTLAHLQHSYTPAGAVEWFSRPNPRLGGRTPLDALAERVNDRDVIAAAAGSRVSVAT